MNFKLLVFYISGVFSLTIALTVYYFTHKGQQTALVFFVALVVSFILLHNVLQQYIQNRISNMYKLIRSLKLGKDMKIVLAQHSSDDPIKNAEEEVRDWAKQNASEIEQLKKQEVYRREFLSNISHEFKTPLFAIQGYIENLQDGMMQDDPVMAQQFLEKAAKNIDRLTFLINDLDEITKLETGQISINMQKFDLAELIFETVSHVEDKAKKQNIQLVADLKSNTPIYVKADRQRIQQVLINLIDNSIKYGIDGGKTKINVYHLLDQILVEVTDNGQGIDEKLLPRVFERFFRTDRSRSRDIGGSGLGLSIVKHIIEAHQQTVHVRSTEGIGTTFGFTLEKYKAS